MGVGVGQGGGVASRGASANQLDPLQPRTLKAATSQPRFGPIRKVELCARGREDTEEGLAGLERRASRGEMADFHCRELAG